MCACLSKLRVRYQNPLQRVYIFICNGKVHFYIFVSSQVPIIIAKGGYFHVQWKSSFLYFCIYVSTYLNKGSFRRMQYCKDGWKFEFKKFNFSDLYQKMQMIQILWDENESLHEILKIISRLESYSCYFIFYKFFLTNCSNFNICH